MKRAIPFVLALLMLVSLCSCLKETGGDTSTTTTAGNSDTIVTTANPIYSDVPTGSYEDLEFNILLQPSGWGLTTMSAEPDGDTINDAVFERNSALERKLGISILVDYTAGNVQTDIEAFGEGKTHRYDVIWTTPAATMALARNGFLEPIEAMTQINLDKEWWYPSTTQDINLGSHTYLAYSDIHLHFHESFYVTAFNKSMITQHESLVSPYDLINNNEWTIDKMHEMMLTVSRKTEEAVEIYGLCAHSNTGYSTLTALDVSLLTLENGKYSFKEVSERYDAAYDKVQRTIFDPALSRNSDYDAPFSAGKSLFLIEVTGALKEHREDEMEYGIVVMPKFDTAQEEFISPIAPSAMTMGVPTYAESDSKFSEFGEAYTCIAIILENFAAESHRLLRPQYYQIQLSFRYAKDETSIAMLDRVYANSRLDVANAFNFNSLVNAVQNCFVNGQKATALSSYIAPTNRIINKEYYSKLTD